MHATSLGGGSGGRLEVPFGRMSLHLAESLIPRHMLSIVILLVTRPS